MGERDLLMVATVWPTVVKYMFEYPYIFWMVALSYGTPVLGKAVGWAFTNWSTRREPLWISLPGYISIHLLAVFLVVAFGLDFDWLKYCTHGSRLWTVIYHGGDALSLVGLAVLLWVRIRKTRRPGSHGFEIFQM